jgi:hypothetical protein
VRTILVAALLTVSGLGSATVAVAADVAVNVTLGPPPPAIVLPAPPALVVVPGVPVVQYVPSGSADLFFHEKRWFYSHGGYWYVAQSYKGPWTSVTKLPAPLVTVPVKYYKIPPGHLKKQGQEPGHGHGKGKGKS